MRSISAEKFNVYIGNNRFISGNEIAWFMSDKTQTVRIGVIINAGLDYQAVTYKQHPNNLFWVDGFRIFNCENDALHFLKKKLENN